MCIHGREKKVIARHARTRKRRQVPENVPKKEKKRTMYHSYMYMYMYQETPHYLITYYVRVVRVFLIKNDALFLVRFRVRRQHTKKTLFPCFFLFSYFSYLRVSFISNILHGMFANMHSRARKRTCTRYLFCPQTVVFSFGG
jgi:hypothetical protein